MNEDLHVGAIVMRAGYFSKAQYYRLKTTDQLEKLIGYEAGTLSDGWWLLFMNEVPTTNDFAMRGYSQMSGGRAYGHLKSHDPRSSAEYLNDSGFDVEKVMRLAQSTFRNSGPERLTKVVPKRRANSYPPGQGIAQWELKESRPKPFTVEAFVGPGEWYQGNYGGPSVGPVVAPARHNWWPPSG